MVNRRTYSPIGLGIFWEWEFGENSDERMAERERIAKEDFVYYISTK